MRREDLIALREQVLSETTCVSCRGATEVRDAYSGELRPCVLCRKAEYEAWCERLKPQTRRLAELDEAGRCCGRKPLVYKRARQLFCARCNASFNIETRRQQPNWAWRAAGDAFVAATPTSEIARRAALTPEQEGRDA